MTIPFNQLIYRRRGTHEVDLLRRCAVDHSICNGCPGRVIPRCADFRNATEELERVKQFLASTRNAE